MNRQRVKKETGKSQALDTVFQLNFEQNQKEVAYAFNKLFFSLAKHLVTDHPNIYIAIKLLNKLKRDQIV